MVLHLSSMGKVLGPTSRKKKKQLIALIRAVRHIWQCVESMLVATVTGRQQWGKEDTFRVQWDKTREAKISCHV